ncbi:MAG TPA: MarR family transcriptional regulator [Jatrophihabitans sp.]|jgi:DNA-binding MarR family transcriptional regulator|uniref:MarR family winged helix-turn-helix transcriptional regulator n=1 Tax=Jatrophihabitans sp. TaxID=1932789 RepID=UPI002DFE851D|nr:MarR family transcriptional regulator [Jatrophihabitans sp.]
MPEDRRFRPDAVGGSPDRRRGQGVIDAEIDAVQAACRVLVAISAQSIAAVEDEVDLAQFRALVVMAGRGSVSLGELAVAVRLHLSTASRMCDRLVGLGLIDRTDDPHNRRQLVLTLTRKGSRLVADVMSRRRAALEPVVRRLPPDRRSQLVSVLREFSQAGDEPADTDLWFMGWAT